MYFKIVIVFFVFLFAGLMCNFFLFTQEKNDRKSNKFITSERLIAFIIQILVGVIGFGITLNLTNDYERDMEKEKALQMFEQAIEYTESEVEEEGAYFTMYADGRVETRIYLNSSVTNLDYFDNVLSNELIMRNVNMIAYGYLMDYLVRIKDTDERARSLTDPSEIKTEMRWRSQYLKKIRDLLIVCYDEMADDITSEEAIFRCKEINQSDLRTYQ